LPDVAVSLTKARIREVDSVALLAELVGAPEANPRMPTNPLWVEHTERAAWDTVEALREQIERERQINARLTRLSPLLPKLARALDEARHELGLTSDDDAVVIAGLVERVRQLSRTKEAIEHQLEERSRELERMRGAADLALAQTAPTEERASALRWFTGLIAKRAQKSPVRPKLDSERLVRALEHKTDELAGSRPDELLELAVDIGYLALGLARTARRQLRRRGQ
jgi:hypothetical protein